MNLTLERLTKYVALTLVLVALVAGLGTQATAATNATSTPTLTVTVGTAATASATNVTFAGPGTIDFTGNYTGTSSLTFSLRTSTSTGSGTVTVKGAGDFSGANGGSGPLIASGNLFYSCDSGDYTAGSPDNLVPGSMTFCQGSETTMSMSSSTNVLTGIGANKKAKDAILVVNLRIPESADYEADTYTGTVTFTVNAN